MKHEHYWIDDVDAGVLCDDCGVGIEELEAEMRRWRFVALVFIFVEVGSVVVGLLLRVIL